MRRDIRDYKVYGKKASKYVPVLDYDPTLAAESLTKADIESAYDFLIEVFDDIREGNIKTHLKDKILSLGDEYCGYAKYPLMSDTIMASEENFTWWATFFRTLEKLLDKGVGETFEIPYEMKPENSEGDVWWFDPFYLSDKGSLKYCETNTKGTIINNYRIRYVMEQYQRVDFVGGKFPQWYLLYDTILFEDYNEKTNVRVRVDFRDGEFKYFKAGASDYWQEIEGVPDDMKHVVSAFIFRNIT